MLRYLLITLLFFQSAYAQNSLLLEAKKQLTIESKPKTKSNFNLNKNVIKVPLKRTPAKTKKKSSVSFLMGSFSNQDTFYHSKFAKTIGPQEIKSSPQFALLTQSQFFTYPTNNLEIGLGAHIRLSYSQTKATISSNTSFDDVRLTNYFYGLGLSFSISKQFSNFSLQAFYQRSYGQQLTSLVSASDSIDYYEKQGKALDFATLRIVPFSDYYLEIQKNFSKETDTWNIGLGLLL